MQRSSHIVDCLVYVTCLTMIQSPIVPVSARMNKSVNTLRSATARYTNTCECEPLASSCLYPPGLHSFISLLKESRWAA